jgi:hypothetical protein
MEFESSCILNLLKETYSVSRSYVQFEDKQMAHYWQTGQDDYVHWFLTSNKNVLCRKLRRCMGIISLIYLVIKHKEKGKVLTVLNYAPF